MELAREVDEAMAVAARAMDVEIYWKSSPSQMLCKKKEERHIYLQALWNVEDIVELAPRVEGLKTEVIWQNSI